MVGFGPNYACAHIIIPVSVNLLPIQADFVTERVKSVPGIRPLFGSRPLFGRSVMGCSTVVWYDE